MTPLHFPEAQPDMRAVQTTVDDLRAQVQSARRLTLVSLGCGVLGIVLALGMGWRARRTSRPSAA